MTTIWRKKSKKTERLIPTKVQHCPQFKIPETHLKRKKFQSQFILTWLQHQYCTFMATLLLWLSSAVLRMCSGLPRLDHAQYDQTPGSLLMSVQLSLIMQNRSCSLNLSVYPPLQISVGSNSGSLWRLIGERAHWFGGWGWGEGHVWTHGALCMSYVALNLEVQCPLWTTHFLYWCSAGPAPLSSFVCVLVTVQPSYGSIKLPKERKCG